MNSILPAIQALEAAYAQLASRFELPADKAPVFTIQTAGRKRAVGWFWAGTWQNGQPTAIPEINLSAEYLSRGFEAAMCTLIHELAHYANYLAGIKDCSAAQYHNKHFKRAAEAFGLVVEKMGRFGYAATSLSSELRKSLEALAVDRKAFELCRLVKRGPKAANKQKLWMCECGVRIRAAVELNVTCNECGTDFCLCE